MIEMKNSTLLDKIIEHAKSYGEDSSAGLTAERYLLSVIDTVSGATSIDIAENEKSKLRDILMNFFPKMQNLKEVKRLLNEHIEGKGKSTYMDALYMQQCMYKAKDIAKQKGQEQLSPELLLTYILDKPSDFIKTYVMKSEKNAAEAAPSASEFAARVPETAAEKTEERQRKESDDDRGMKTFSKETVAALTEKVKRIHDRLIGSVYGQDNAVSVFTAGYFQAELLSLTDKDRTRPKATFLFAGPPGVGKTFLAEKAAEVLQLPYQRFDMSEYSDKEASIEFCGSDNVYKNAKSGNVTSFVESNPKCVILFDEIEKAHISVIHLFLQILDAGRIRDSCTDREVPFTDAILFFTTNAGRQLYEDSDATDYSGVTRKVILKALQNDTDPTTGAAYFPAAICSRFASGNVVMFNHIAAYNLRAIAKKEVLRHAKNFENEVGIQVKIDEKVYTALLFAEGGAADARMIRSRAETFFDDELFELFRLLDTDRVSTKIKDLEAIHIGVDLPTDDKELYELFERESASEVLVFSSQQACEQCAAVCPTIKFINAQSINEAKRVLHEHDISFVLIDLTFGKSGESNCLNIEDEDSIARDFFRFVREFHAETPLYLLQTADRELSDEEKLSFQRQGVRDFVSLSLDKAAFAAEMSMITEQLHQQESMERLAKANKLVSFQTSQAIKDDGKTAEITLFDFEMKVAIDAEDSKNILSNLSKPNVRFDQVIGAEEAKKELKYFVEYLKHPKKYIGTGVSAPRGVLLYGPPGTGKTMLAKAMAKESDVTFIAAEGNQFLNRYQGVGRDRVKELFRAARKYAPSILFIDEIDAIAKERRGGDNASDVEATLTAFLAEMDGFKNDTSKPVFVLAATNFEVEPGSPKSLDPALMRRFDRRVYIDLPTKEERIRYIRMKLAEKTAFELTEDKISNIAIRSTGMSLAELESVFELSLRTAIRDGNLKVTDDIFDEAFETFHCGEMKKWDASQLERTARHEAGHAFLCWESGETPSYVTVVARGDHGGYMQHDSNEEKAIYTKDELLAKIRTALGGRAAEIVYYGEKAGVSTGAGGDLVSATRMARQLICAYGMDDEMGLAVVDPQEAQSGVLALDIRRSVNKILDREMKHAIRLIDENKPIIDLFVGKLLAENHLTGNEVKAIFESRS